MSNTLTFEERLQYLRNLALLWAEGAGDAMIQGSEMHCERWLGVSLGMGVAVEIMAGKRLPPLKKPELHPDYIATLRANVDKSPLTD